MNTNSLATSIGMRQKLPSQWLKSTQQQTAIRDLSKITQFPNLSTSVTAVTSLGGLLPEVNTWRSVHSPRFRFIITLIISRQM